MLLPHESGKYGATTGQMVNLPLAQNLESHQHLESPLNDKLVCNGGYVQDSFLA